MVALRSLLWSLPSSTPVTVTVWVVFHLDGVKVKVAGLTVATVPMSEVTVMVTFPFGLLSSTTV